MRPVISILVTWITKARPLLAHQLQRTNAGQFIIIVITKIRTISHFPKELNQKRSVNVGSCIEKLISLFSLSQSSWNFLGVLPFKDQESNLVKIDRVRFLLLTVAVFNIIRILRSFGLPKDNFPVFLLDSSRNSNFWCHPVVKHQLSLYERFFFMQNRFFSS